MQFRGSYFEKVLMLEPDPELERKKQELIEQYKEEDRIRRQEEFRKQQAEKEAAESRINGR